ncbi:MULTISPECIES: hypothetical protein [unclassified Prochlorococcus]|uniref:hypothetical protein n=1 Tax=unclassified Prochlorococcus TaxID=2627481 RepID=UPI0012EBAA97|nr:MULTISPECIES: hypothetical protein [unclassified Prochlorococcus]
MAFGIFIGNNFGKYIKKRRLVNNQLLEISLFYIPLLAISGMIGIALFTFKPGLTFEYQPYMEFAEYLKGRAIIHLLPAGLVYKLNTNSINKRTLYYTVIIAILYVFLYGERAYIVPFCGILLINLNRKNLLNFGKLINYTFYSIFIFILVELSRSWVVVRLVANELNLFEAIRLSFLRLGVYYADTFFKISACLDNTQYNSIMKGCRSVSLDWYTTTLTNRGFISYIFPNLPYLYILALLFIFSYITSKIIKSYEKSNYLGWDSLIAPYLFTAFIEIPRWDYPLRIRFWMIFPILIFLSYTSSKSEYYE